MHIDDERIQRLLHGELPQADEVAARRHLAECGDCRARLAAARREEDEVYALLRQVDHGVPHVAAAAIVTQARTRAMPWLRWAAAIILALGVAGAAYAIPGSPLRAWVQRLTRRAPPTPTSPPSPPSPDSSTAGIAVPPGRDLVVQFQGSPPVAQVDVLLTDDADVEVRTVTGSATFAAGTDRLVVDNRSPQATFDVRIPRAAPRVAILLRETRIVLKEGARVVTEPSARCRADNASRYVCFPQP